jgi:hypothetical protein
MENNKGNSYVNALNVLQLDKTCIAIQLWLVEVVILCYPVAVVSVNNISCILRKNTALSEIKKWNTKYFRKL